MKKPVRARTASGSTRWVCKGCGLSYEDLHRAEACCFAAGVRTPQIKLDLQKIDGTLTVVATDAQPDHWLAAAEALEAFAKELRAGARSPEDMGLDVILLGRLMRRAT